MLNKRNILGLVFIATLFNCVVAQNRTFSPYSRFGLGDIQGTSIGRLQGMGGVGVAQRSAYTLNDLNAASLTAIDSMSFMFEAGVGFFGQKIKASDASSSAKNANFDLFAFGFPITKWSGLSLGVRPFAGTGYNIASTSGVSPDQITTTSTGEGSVADAFLAFGFKPIKNLSLGITLSYLFGSEKHYSYNDFINDSQAMSTATLREITVSDFKFDLGAQYVLPISDSRKFIFGTTFRPMSPISGEVHETTETGMDADYTGNRIYTNNYTGTMAYRNGSTLLDTITPLSYYNSKLPMQLGLGITYEVADKLSASIDYTYANWSQTPFYDQSTTTVDSHNFAAGAEYIPNDLKTGQFFNRLRYRVGGFYKKEYLEFNNNQLTNYGITFGTGIPLRRTKNSVNLAFTYGVRGKTTDGLLQENYYRLSLNVALHEFWFVKRKFD